MKNLLKKVISSVAAVAMAATLVGGVASSLTAKAAETTTPVTGTLTINVNDSEADHDYEAYQIFAGTLSKTSDPSDTSKPTTYQLSDITWGDGVNSSKEGFDTAITGITVKGEHPFSSADAKSVADKLGENGTKDNDIVTAFASTIAKYLSSTKTKLNYDNVSKTKYTGTVDKAGYYLVQDESQKLADGEGYTKYLLEVAKETTEITPKKGTTELEKKVQENSNPAAYQDVADYQIGDNIPYKLTGTLPSNFSYYKTYKKFIFTDTLSAGLTMPTEANDETKPTGVTVRYYDSKTSADTDATGTSGTDVTSLFDVSYAGGSETTAPYVDSHILTVELRDNVDLKTDTTAAFNNEGAFVVRYTAKLNDNANIGTATGNPNKAKLTYSSNPNFDGEGGNEPTGDTTEDQAIVFTYELDNYKGNENNAALKDAKFVLLNADASKYAKFNTNGKLTGWENVPTSNERVASSYNADGILTSDANGLFKAIGLDAATYKLREVEAPSGYNKLSNDITVTIGRTLGTVWDGVVSKDSLVTNLNLTSDNTAEYKANASLTNNGAGEASTGKVTGTVINTAGSLLPSTGGIGTKLFYVIGGVIVAGAAILLIAKRKKRA